MTSALALGWVLAGGFAGFAVTLHRRLELVAQAEHELRRPLAALALGARLDDGDSLSRVRLALDDLSAARRGCRLRRTGALIALDRLVRRAAAEAAPAARAAGGSIALDWRAGPVTVCADEDRLLQALSNVLANAVEHGGGAVEVEGVRTAASVRVDVRDGGPGFRRRLVPLARSRDRGRGLRIAARALGEAGGRLRVRSPANGACVVLELPIADRLLPAQLSLVEVEPSAAHEESLAPS